MGVVLLCLIIIGLLLVGASRNGGQLAEPHASAVIERPPIRFDDPKPVDGRMTGNPASPGPEEQPLPPRSDGRQVESASGVNVVRQHGGTVPGAAIIRVPDTAEIDRAPGMADPRISERSAVGTLPRVSDGGLTPRRLYARSYSPDGKPMIAVVMTGVGVNARSTADAIQRLSGAFTLAFAPYGRDLEAQVLRARRNGHEIMLQIPMEPFDYPENDPGPHTIRASLSVPENIDRLHWLMSRFSGYVGIMNFMGEKLMANPQAYQPVLEEINRRGLLFLDDGHGKAVAGTGIPARIGLASARADRVLASAGSTTALRTVLADAEALAMKNGRAIIAVPALTANIEMLQAWEQDLKGRGISLAPLSALVASRPK